MTQGTGGSQGRESPRCQLPLGMGKVRRGGGGGGRAEWSGCPRALPGVHLLRSLRLRLRPGSDRRPVGGAAEQRGEPVSRALALQLCCDGPSHFSRWQLTCIRLIKLHVTDFPAAHTRASVLVGPQLPASWCKPERTARAASPGGAWLSQHPSPSPLHPWATTTRFTSRVPVGTEHRERASCD